MKKIIFIVFIFFLSCYSTKKHTNLQVPYENWVNIVDSKIKEEMSRVKEKCQGDFFLNLLTKQIRLIDIKKNKKILDTLVQKYITNNGFIIIDKYFQGFNQSHTTGYWIVLKNNDYCQGIEYERSEIEPLEIENAVPYIKKDLKEKYHNLSKHFKPYKVIDCDNPAYSVVTELDTDFNVIRCEVIYGLLNTER